MTNDQREPSTASAPIRVGFAHALGGTEWLGGVSYSRNLFLTVQREQVGIQPVALISRNANATMAFGEIEGLRTPLFERRATRAIRRALVESLGVDILLEKLLRENGIEVLSHSGLMGRRSRIPSVNWIPDLQHRRLPQFFEERDRRRRDRVFARICGGSTVIVVSSECVKNDLEEFFPGCHGRVRVLRFVDSSAGEAPPIELSLLAQKYGIRGPYFLVPNQFWVHKNHKVILRALAILKQRGRQVTVLATGNAVDYRAPNHFRELMEFRKGAGLESHFSCLGIVPFGDLANLARGAVALINPSLFEGWSTSVEEAKSLGKAILLSDIPVHREQAPDRGVYFEADDAGALADLMLQAWEAHDPVLEAQASAEAAAALPGRRRDFAARYFSIVSEAVSMHRAQREQ